MLFFATRCHLGHGNLHPWAAHSGMHQLKTFALPGTARGKSNADVSLAGPHFNGSLVVVSCSSAFIPLFSESANANNI